MVVGTVVFLTTATAGASLNEQAEAFERALQADLQTRDAEAAALFAEANRTRARGDHAAAAELYGRAHERVPAFAPALRRQGWELVAEGKRVEGIAVLREAVESEQSAENLAALAAALASGAPGIPPVPADLSEAAELAARAVEAKPDDYWIQAASCQVAMARHDLFRLEGCSAALVRLGPEDPGSHYFRAIDLAFWGKLDDADRALKQARQLGLPEAPYRELHRAIEAARPLGPRLIRLGGWIIGAWATGLLALFILGWMLSQAVLALAKRMTATNSVTVTPARWLRRIYAGVLWLSCGYYYLSIPIVAVIVLFVAGGIIYGFLAVGLIPLKLVAIVLAVAVVSVVALFRSLLVRRAGTEPGLRLDLEGHGALRDLLIDVAARVGTRPVDAVYISPGTEIGVFEQGGMLRRLRHRTVRCLLLGLGVLDGMRIGPFKAILAHEYGHFQNRDTAGGALALTVRRSLATSGMSLARKGVAAWFNPAWLFVSVFYRLFLRISQGASRLQEILADRRAASLFGARPFEEGLRHVAERSERFRRRIDVTMNEVVRNKRALPNLYTYTPDAPEDPDKLAEAVATAFARTASPYDSHPSPADRIAWVRRCVPEDGSSGATSDGDEVWTLFADRDDLERAMTRVVRTNVRARYGVDIAESAATVA